MKFILPVVVFAVSALTISFSYKKHKKVQISDGAGFALVELFTSEGCSSCPPADKAVEEIQTKYSGKNVLVLGYHVDYWDRLGWKDVFSDAAFTARQNYYAEVFDLNSIYTPQAIVNGIIQFVGSDRSKLTSSINEQLKENPSASIRLKVVQNQSGKIDITFSIKGTNAKEEHLNMLLVQKMATDKIQRGENEGRTLHHINIVREFSEMPAQINEQKAAFKLPPDLRKEDVFIAAFIQNKKTGKITAIQSSPVE